VNRENDWIEENSTPGVSLLREIFVASLDGESAAAGYRYDDDNKDI
jgi:hypothetical protein